MSSFHCRFCQLTVSSDQPLCFATSRGTHALSQMHTRSPSPMAEGTSHKPLLSRSTAEHVHVHRSIHGLGNVLIMCHEPCRLASRAHVPNFTHRRLTELALIASNPSHAIHRQQIHQARLVQRRRRPRMFEGNASTSLDLLLCPSASKLQVTPAMLQQHCDFVWLGR